MDRLECVHGVLHCPLAGREVRPRESFRSWECEASSHRFSTKGPAPQKATRGRARTQKVRQLPDETQRTKFAQAAKIFIHSSTESTEHCLFSSVISATSAVKVKSLKFHPCVPAFRRNSEFEVGPPARENIRSRAPATPWDCEGGLCVERLLLALPYAQASCH
jgi:hypothetical protein